MNRTDFEIDQSRGQTPVAFSVSEINTMVADVLSGSLPGFLWVEGEISNLSKATSGHRYFSLKDSQSNISCALFRGAAQRISNETLSALQNGDQVIVKASLSVYKPRGDYQLIVSDVEPAGFGALAKDFANLKNKLEKLGMTAAEKKRPIPKWPKAIAVVTSATGAAIRDVLTTLNRRAPFIPIHVYPAQVQGHMAASEILTSLAAANADNDVDVIVLVRGGGSLEDLHAFNDEQVAMAVANSQTPIVTGVGHETDFTIVDFVSDFRAATPTAAAEMVSPDKLHLKGLLAKQKQRMEIAMAARIQNRKGQLDAFSHRLAVRHPKMQLQQQAQRLDELVFRLQQRIRQIVAFETSRLSQLDKHLGAHSPLKKISQSQLNLEKITYQLYQVMNLHIDSEQYKNAQYQQRIQQTQAQFKQYHQQLKGLDARLQLLSPLGMLERGYTLVFDNNGELVRSAADIKPDTLLSLRFADGVLPAVTTQTAIADKAKDNSNK